MKRIELTIGSIAIIAILYRLLFWTELNFVIIISISLLTVFYGAFSFVYFNGLKFREILKKKTYSKLSKKRIIWTIAIGLAISYILNGLLFKLMLWPFSGPAMQLGLILIVLSGLIGFSNYIKSKSELSISVLAP